MNLILTSVLLEVKIEMRENDVSVCSFQLNGLYSVKSSVTQSFGTWNSFSCSNIVSDDNCCEQTVSVIELEL